MDNFITLIGSIVIGTLLMLSVLSFQTDVKEHSYKKTYELILQGRALNLVKQVAEDFRQIGYGVNYDALAVYDSSWIRYYVDIGNDGVIDTVHYELSDTSAATGTTNPRDKILYRWTNSNPKLNFPMGIIDFRIKYFDAMGNEITNLQEIKTLQIEVECESPEPISGEYSKFFWKEKITPLNLQPN